MGKHTHQTERDLDRRGARRVLLELHVLCGCGALPTTHELEDIACSDLALEESVVTRVHRSERVRHVSDSEDMLRRNPRRRVLLDLDLWLVVLLRFVFHGGTGGEGEGLSVSRRERETPERAGDLVDRLCDLERAPDPRHASVRAVGDNGLRERLAQQGRVGRLPCTQELCRKSKCQPRRQGRYRCKTQMRGEE